MVDHFDRKKKLAVAYHLYRTNSWSDDRFNCHSCQRRRDYRKRGCKLEFPGKLPLKPRDPTFDFIPVYNYKTRDDKGRPIERQFSIPEFKVAECPVSLLSTTAPGDGFHVAGKEPELVRKYFLGKKAGKTLAQLLRSDAGWIEDVQDVMRSEAERVKDAYDKAKQRRLAAKE